MEDMKITAKIVTVGFKPSELRPKKMWTVLQNEFLELYNDYCEVTNERIPALNEVYKALNPKYFEEDESEEKDELTPEEQEIMDLKDKIQEWEYASYMTAAMGECAFEVNQKHSGSYLSGFVILDGEAIAPVFAARIKQHPEMSMMFVIEK